MLEFYRARVLRFTHGAEHYCAVAYSACEVFEMHQLIIVVTAFLFAMGIGSVLYELLEG